ncbi:MAG: HlyC/CorC family transporter [Lachnospiraceae bacterium]|nr:HlyC/CorC family transporter [Lachnospiraceae bacterium]
MDSDVWLRCIILAVLLLLSAFFSSAETALTTVNLIRMRTFAEEGNKRSALVLKIHEQNTKMLSAILVGNNVVNLSASALTTGLVVCLFGSIAAGVATGILTFLILIFGEIVPKTAASLRADKLSMLYAPVIYGLMVVLTPVIFAINQLSRLVLLLFRINPDAKKEAMTEEELKTIVDVSEEQGVIENEERQIIRNLFDFTEAEAKEVMVPRIHMTFVPVEASYDEIFEVFRESGYSRLPVYEGSKDKVIGILYLKDLVFYEDKGHFSARSICRDPYMTFEHKNTAELLAEMRTASISIAIVLDEYGVTAGMVSLEDLLEEIVGEIHDEYDAAEEEDITRLSPGKVRLKGTANLESISEELKLPFSSEDSDSVGGFVIELLGHVPKEGEQVVTEDGYRFTVERMELRSIDRLLLEFPKQ